MLPDRIGRYEVRGLAGSGGFATVYEGFDPRLDARVAIKVLADNWSRDPEIVRRFRQEAVLLRKLQTEQGVPGLVEVFDIDETDSGQPFFVMGWADQGSLDERSAGRAWPYEAVEPVIDSLTQSLGHLHARGVVHRDIKPANLLLRSERDEARPADRLIGPGERLVVGDLGLAKDFMNEASSLSLVAGTERYMAPEQLVFGGSIDHRADVHASAAMFTELLAGPDGELPAHFRQVLDKGTARDRDQRHSTMAELGEALRQAHQRETSPPQAATNVVVSAAPSPEPAPEIAPTPSPEPSSAPQSVRGSRNRILVAALVALAVIVAGALALRGGADVEIVGPDTIVSGEVAVFSVDPKPSDVAVWTDPGGARVEGSTLEITARLPGELTISVEADDATATRSVTVEPSPDGPTIIGPETVARGETGLFSAAVPVGHSFYWLHPTLGQVFSRELSVDQTGDRFVLGLVSIDEDGIERADQRMIPAG